MNAIEKYLSDVKKYEITIIESGRDVFLNYMFIVNDKKTNDAIIIDPGWDAEFIIDFLTKHNLKCRGILITHTHADHVHEAAEISTKLDCSIFMSNKEASVSGYKHQNLKTFYEHTELCCGSIKCIALLTPGHTQGSSCFVVGNRLFTGDTLFIEGCGLCTGYDGSTEQMFNSIEFLKSIVPDSFLVYPGHMYMERIAKPFSFLKQHNFYLKTKNRKTFEVFCKRASLKERVPPKYESAKILNTKLVDF